MRWKQVTAYVIIALVTILNLAAACAHMKPKLAWYNMPPEFPECNKDIRWNWGKLEANGPYGDYLVICMMSKSGTYEWQIFKTEPIR